jgi:hypothetical protein
MGSVDGANLNQNAQMLTAVFAVGINSRDA